MADIILNLGAKNLDGLKKLLQEIRKYVEEMRRIMEKTGMITEDDAIKAKRLTAEMMRIENEIKKQERTKKRIEEMDSRRVNKLKEEVGIIGSLQKKIKEVESAWKGATDQVTKGKLKNELIELRKELDKAKGSTNTWGNALGSFQFKFNALGNIAANVLKNMTNGMKQFARDSIRTALEVEGVKVAFNRLDDPTLLNNLRKVVNSTVSDMRLMQLAIKANNFKVPIEQIADYLKFLDLRADQTGENIESLAESFFTAVGKQMPRSLTTVGISTKRFNEELDKTKNFTVALNNIIQEEFTRSGGSIDKATDAVEQYTATIENLKASAGKFFFKNILDTEEWTNFFKVFNDDNISGWNKFVSAFSQKRAAGLVGVQEDLQDTLDQVKKFRQGIGAQSTPLISINELEFDVKEIEDIFSELNNDIFEGFQEYGEMMDKEDAENHETRIRNAEKSKEERLKIEREFNEDLFKLKIDVADEFHEFFSDRIAEIDKENSDRILDNIKKENKETKESEDAKLAIKMAALEAIGMALNYLSARNNAAMERELANTSLTEEQKDQIRKKYAKKEQNIAVGQAVINGAVSITKAISTIPFPASLVVAGIYAAMTGLEIAIIKAQKFAKGGRIGGRSHDQGGTLIEAEKDEFIVNKKSAKKHLPILEAINADDRLRIANAFNVDRRIEVHAESKYTKKLYELMKNKTSSYETPEFFVIQKGTTEWKLRKNNGFSLN